MKKHIYVIEKLVDQDNKGRGIYAPTHNHRAKLKDAMELMKFLNKNAPGFARRITKYVEEIQ